MSFTAERESADIGKGAQPLEQAKQVQARVRRPGRVKEKIRMFSVRAGIDLPFLTIVLVLLTIGLIMLFSASYAYALAYYGNSYHFFKNQLIWAILGIAAMILCSYFDYHKFHKLAVPILILSYMLLVLVLFMPARNGAHRWISIGGAGFQPAALHGEEGKAQAIQVDLHKLAGRLDHEFLNEQVFHRNPAVSGHLRFLGGAAD